MAADGYRCCVPFNRFVLMLAGGFAVAVIAFGATMAHGPGIVARLERQAEAARDKAGGHGVAIRFTTPQGWLTRHPVLSGGTRLDAATRARVAAAIAGVPGVGGVTWRAGENRPGGGPAAVSGKASLHCQQDVEAILRARTIRFDEASSVLDPVSNTLLDEVAGALRPCVGSIIAVIGHTDSGGDPGANLALSRARADAVRWALIGRGIPADGLRASGRGADEPLHGLDPADPANRRIEFSVIATEPLSPTPVDTPGPG